MKKRAKRGKLSRKLLTGLAILAEVLFLFTSIFVGIYHHYTEMDDYSSSAFAYAKGAANFIDGDRAISYLEPAGKDETGEPIYERDEYFSTVTDFIVSLQAENSLMKYFYVFVPNEDTVTYIWDSEEDSLGYTEEYMEGGKEAVAKVFNKEPVEELAIFSDDTYGLIACAYYPIYNSSGEPVAVVGVDLAMDGIRGELFRYILTIVLTNIVVTIAVSAFYYSRIKRILVNPIRQLNDATKSLVRDLDQNRDLDLEIHTNDELEDLAGSFVKMQGDLGKYIQELATVTSEKERISTELNVATQIQADMLPRKFPAFPDRKEFDLYASMDPAKEVGGDFYDFFLIDRKHLALIIADVSGKGVPAALFMVNAKTLIKDRLMQGESPAEALTNVNNELCEGNEAELFVTVWLAVLELSTGKGIAVNAGHEHPAIRRADGKYELVVYHHCPAVATMEDIQFKQHEFELFPGDTLFQYTDGVTEATDANGNLFGTDRMIDALNQSSAVEPKEILSAVKTSIDAFVGEEPQFDDLTMLCLRYFGPDKNRK